PAPPPAPSGAAPGGTVLLVEDDALIRLNSAEILQSAGYIVIEAGSAEEAHLALQTTPIDVVVTDLNLPGASGEHLAAFARELRPAARLVFATGDATAVKLEAGVQLLTKPYDARALLAAVGHQPGAADEAAQEPAKAKSGA
ncbi:response regulator, partial [Chelatococcus sambhunathii]